MMGFGRAGEMWGFQHYPGVIPDIVTAAKGLTASITPLALVALREPLREFFQDTSTGWGATFVAHPVSLACAHACIKHVLDENLVGRVQELAPVMEEEIEKLVANHPSVARGRSYGLFGCLDLVDPEAPGQPAVQLLQGPPSPKANEFKAALKHHGVFGLLRLPLVHITPPLVINEEQLRDAMARVSAALNDSFDKNSR
jgi:taurine--2-oxoglutarate transaminase